jgi:hypothetical protein
VEDFLATIEKTDLGRNDPCHCGSGKKYKASHLEKDDAAARKARATAAEAAPAAEPAAEVAAEDGPRPAGAAPKHTTRQPWKGRQDSRGFQNTKAHIPRRSGGS